MLLKDLEIQSLTFEHKFDIDEAKKHLINSNIKIINSNQKLSKNIDEINEELINLKNNLNNYQQYYYFNIEKSNKENELIKSKIKNLELKINDNKKIFNEEKTTYELYSEQLNNEKSKNNYIETNNILLEFEKLTDYGLNLSNEELIQSGQKSLDILKIIRDLHHQNIQMKYSIKRASIIQKIPELNHQINSENNSIEEYNNLIIKKNKLIEEINELEKINEINNINLENEINLKFIDIPNDLIEFLKIIDQIRNGNNNINLLKNIKFMNYLDGTEKYIYELSQNRREFDLETKNLIHQLELFK